MKRFLQDELGVAATEYLTLLAILVGGVLFAVALAALSMSQAYNSWGDFYVGLSRSI